MFSFLKIVFGPYFPNCRTGVGKLCGVTDQSQTQLVQFLKDEITEHLQSLENEVERYFPGLLQEQDALVKNTFVMDLMYPASQMISKMSFWILGTTLQLVISSR